MPSGLKKRIQAGELFRALWTSAPCVICGKAIRAADLHHAAQGYAHPSCLAPTVAPAPVVAPAKQERPA